MSDIGYSPCREQRLADVVAHHSADRVFGVGVKIWTLYMYVFAVNTVIVAKLSADTLGTSQLRPPHLIRQVP